MRHGKLLLSVSLVLVFFVFVFQEVAHSQSDEISRSIRELQPTKSKRHPISLAPIIPQSIYAPLVTLGDSAQTELIINNVAGRMVDVRYTVYSLSGETVATGNLPLHPMEVRYVYVSDLFKDIVQERARDLGGIALDYNGRSMGLLAQILYLGGKERNSIDGSFFHAMDLPSNTQSATWSTPRDARSTLIVGNSSDAPIGARLAVDSHDVQKLRIAPHATWMIRLERSPGDTTAHFATLTYDGAGGSLRESGFVTAEHGYAAPIRFYDRAASPQADLFATDLPVRDASVTMTLLNTGRNEVTARPQLFPREGENETPVELETITLGPGQSAKLTFLGAEKRLHNIKSDVFSLRVESSGGFGDLIGSLVSVQRDDEDNDVVAEVPLRVPGMPGQSTGSYPVRMDGDYTSRVTITNVGAEQRKYFAYLQTPSGKFTFIPASLAPGQAAGFDINEIRDQQQKDVFGHTLARDLKTAKFVWSIAAPWGSARMIGRAYVQSKKNRISASYSCGVCCPSIVQGPFASPEPEGIFNVGDIASGSIWSEQNDCEGNLTTFPSSLGGYGAQNVCSYSENNGAFQLSAVGVGSTSMSYDFTWANLLADSQDCFLQGPFDQTNTDTVTVNTTITPSRSLFGRAVDVTITGAGFDSNETITVSGNGISVANLSVKPPTKITAQLLIKLEADIGNHTINFSPSGASVDFFVQKPTFLAPFERPGFPKGVQKLQVVTDGPIVDANGMVKAEHRCGVYQNYLYTLFDQEKQQIVQAYTSVESFDHYTGPFGEPSEMQAVTGDNGILSDIASISRPAGECLSATDKEFLQQHMNILGVNVTPCITFTKGNLTGNSNASPSQYNVIRTLSCQK